MNQLDPIMQFFSYKHLPTHLQAVSKPFSDLAHKLVGVNENGNLQAEGSGDVTHLPVPRNPERTVALRKLLEAKDAAVRAVLFKDEVPAEGGAK